jgi:hypothetical protein
VSKFQIHLEAFFGALLEDYKAGELSKEQAIGGLVCFSVALNNGDFETARRWAEQGRKLARDLISLDQAEALLSVRADTRPH